MGKYNIYAGMGGGFGGAQYQGTVECKSLADAYELAYELAVQEYESYEGYHGVPDYGEIADNAEDYGLEEGFTEEDVYEILSEQRESWIEYYAVAFEDDEDFDEDEDEVYEL